MIRLASSSITRAKLLGDFCVEFIQESIEFDEEKIHSNCAKNFVYQATLGKYEANFKHFGIEEHPLLVADTVITSGGMLLRKARSINEARNILLTQSGSVTSIITCMIYHSQSLKLIDISYTDYLFGEFDEADLEAYLQSGEWQGKAGACMVEGFCKSYIKEVRGYESTAMGLCVEKLQPFLRL